MAAAAALLLRPTSLLRRPLLSSSNTCCYCSASPYAAADTAAAATTTATAAAAGITPSRLPFSSDAAGTPPPKSRPTAAVAAANLRPTTAAAAAAANSRPTAAAAAAAAGLSRAATLLLNKPPPDYEVSVHLGLKVQASLLLQRQPRVYRELQHEQKFREFKEIWEAATNNSSTLSDEITFMQLPGHFLETQQQQQQRQQQQQKTGDAQLSELDMLLQQEGLQVQRSRKKGSTQQQQMWEGASSSAAAAGEREEQSLSRLPERVLLLVVRYGDTWQFPVEDRRQGQTMRQTLARLCMNQLGLAASPFFVGFAPAAVRRIRNKKHAVIQGREVFYYRAYHVPGRPQVSPPPDSPVTDFAWVTHEEVKERLGPNAFAAIKNSLLLS